jgi:hypothetical protein
MRLKELIEKERIRVLSLTPEQRAKELERLAAQTKKQIENLEKAKKISPDLWRMEINI